MNEYFEKLKCGAPQKIADRMKSLEKRVPKLGEDCLSEKCAKANRPWCFQDCINTCAQLIYSRHFGFGGPALDSEDLEGVELAQTYFSMVGDDLAKAGGKRKRTDEIAWFEPYSETLLLSPLAGCTRPADANFRSAASDARCRRVAIPIELALGDVLLCMAASFQSSPMDTAPLQKRLKSSRKPRPKLLFKAWQSL